MYIISNDFRFIWKNKEGGKMKMLVQETNVPIIDPDVKEIRMDLLLEYFAINRKNHTGYAFTFFFCELLNLVNVVGQIFFIDFFLGGEFHQYGNFQNFLL